MLTDCDICNFMILLFIMYYSVYSIYLIILYFRVTLNSNSFIYSNLILPIYFKFFFSFSAYIQATGTHSNGHR